MLAVSSQSCQLDINLDIYDFVETSVVNLDLDTIRFRVSTLITAITAVATALSIPHSVRKDDGNGGDPYAGDGNLMEGDGL